jgi:hypothetical protein
MNTLAKSRTSGGGWIIGTNYIPLTGPMIVSAPFTTITGTWQSDGAGAVGDPSSFTVGTGSEALAAVDNGRVPATWKVQWANSQSFPDCTGLSSIATPGAPGALEELICFENAEEAENGTFVFSPNPINLNGTIPTTSVIIGSGFTSTYGMPLVRYFNSQGTLLSQASATFVSQDGTKISAPTPSLNGISVGTYAGVISNIAANGNYVYVGAASVRIIDPPGKSPCVTLTTAVSPDYLPPPCN